MKNNPPALLVFSDQGAILVVNPSTDQRTLATNPQPVVVEQSAPAREKRVASGFTSAGRQARCRNFSGKVNAGCAPFLG